MSIEDVGDRIHHLHEWHTAMTHCPHQHIPCSHQHILTAKHGQRIACTHQIEEHRRVIRGVGVPHHIQALGMRPCAEERNVAPAGLLQRVGVLDDFASQRELLTSLLAGNERCL